MRRKKMKNLLTIVFSKSDFAWGGSFVATFFSEKAKTLGICPSFSGKVGFAQFQKCPVSPPPDDQVQFSLKVFFC